MYDNERSGHEEKLDINAGNSFTRTAKGRGEANEMEIMRTRINIVHNRQNSQVNKILKIKCKTD